MSRFCCVSEGYDKVLSRPTKTGKSIRCQLCLHWECWLRVSAALCCHTRGFVLCVLAGRALDEIQVSIPCHACEGFAKLLNHTCVLLLTVSPVGCVLQCHHDECSGFGGPFALLVSHACSVQPSCDRLLSWFQYACCDCEDEIATDALAELVANLHHHWPLQLQYGQQVYFRSTCPSSKATPHSMPN